MSIESDTCLPFHRCSASFCAGLGPFYYQKPDPPLIESQHIQIILSPNQSNNFRKPIRLNTPEKLDPACYSEIEDRTLSRKRPSAQNGGPFALTNKEQNMTPEERAEIARKNGAKSKGPTTAAGKEQSKRNAIKHGERAEALKLLVPPHSACLLHEQRREFYKLFDRNIAKYQASDEHEKEIVREITDLQWSNGRARLALHTMLNRELIRTGASVQPIDELTFNGENIIAAYESLAANKAVKLFHKEYAVNTRLIIALERRLAHVQRHWPGKAKGQVNSNEERAFFGLEETTPNEGTGPEAPQPVENTVTSTENTKKVVNVVALRLPAMAPRPRPGTEQGLERPRHA